MPELIVKGIKPSSLLLTDEDHQDHYKKERRMEKKEEKRKGKRKGKRRSKRAKRKKMQE